MVLPCNKLENGLASKMRRRNVVGSEPGPIANDVPPHACRAQSFGDQRTQEGQNRRPLHSHQALCVKMATKMAPLRLTSPLFVFRAGFRPAIAPAAPLNARLATQSSIPNAPPTPKRRSVTVVNDTGRVPWESLSLGEKAARTTQQTFNLGLVLVGIAATAGVFTVLYLEVFSTDSKTAVFNRSADRVRKDPKCIEILAGEGMHTKREITAHGEPSHSRWARNRTIASRIETDRTGVEHLHMHFYVEGPAAHGTVNLHMTKAPGEKDFEYRTLALDVPGHQRHYLVNADGLSSGLSKSGGRLFGVRWN